MKKLLFIGLCLFPFFCNAQNASCPMQNISLQDQEVLDYYAFFQLGALHINGMTAHVDIIKDSIPEQKIIPSKDSLLYDTIITYEPYFAVNAVCETEKTMETFYNMVDSFWLQIREKDLLPIYFREHDFEKKRETHKDYHFSFTDSSTTIQAHTYVEDPGVEGTYAFSRECPLDALSLLARLRNFPIDSAQIGEIYSFSFFSKGKSVPLSIQYLGKDTITLRNDTSYRCKRFIFNTIEGTLFSKKHPVSVWLTDDGNQEVLYGEAKLKIGYARFELTGIKNNKYPMQPFVLDRKDRRKR